MKPRLWDAIILVLLVLTAFVWGYTMGAFT